MCTRFYVEPRYYSSLITRAQQSALAKQMIVKIGKPLTMSRDIFPTSIAAVLAPNKDGKPAVFPMLWGFTHDAVDKAIVNCRIESADQKELWKDSWYRRRCIIPATWYYEWAHPDAERTSISGQKQKKAAGQKYLIQPKDADTTYLAGLYRMEEHRGITVPVFAVITRDAVGDLKEIHDRMPLIIGREDILNWIRVDSDPWEISQKGLTEMCWEKAV